MAEYSLCEMTDRKELDEFVELWWNVRQYPYVPFVWMLDPSQGDTSEDRERALASSKERAWNAAQASTDGQRQWLFAKDRQGRIVGGVQWQWHAGSPFPNGVPKIPMPWWPEGEKRNFCEEMLAQAMTPRSLWMQREHGGISIIVVHPKHQCRGVGSLMMRWVTDKLDQKGIEGFIEASAEGKMCYQKNGFQPVLTVDFFIPPGKSDVWNQYFHELKPAPINMMWRPVNGGPDPDGRTRPWQLRSSVPTQ